MDINLNISITINGEKVELEGKKNNSDIRDNVGLGPIFPIGSSSIGADLVASGFSTAEVKIYESNADQDLVNFLGTTYTLENSWEYDLGESPVGWYAATTSFDSGTHTMTNWGNVDTGSGGSV